MPPAWGESPVPFDAVKRVALDRAGVLVVIGHQCLTSAGHSLPGMRLHRGYITRHRRATGGPLETAACSSSRI
jgi:hypothetical protein